MARKLLNKDSMVEWLSHNRDNIDITGNYMGSSIPTEFRCAEGHTWVTTPNSIKNGTGCPHCSLNARCTVEKFNEYLMINQRPVLMVGEYVNNRTKTKFLCSNGHTWEALPTHIKNGTGCPTCSGKQRFSKDNFNELLIAKGNNIKLIGDCESTKAKTYFQCQEGHIWKTSPNSIQQGTGCPACSIRGFKKDKEAWFYILAFGDYIKYGITNSLDSRLDQHKRHNGEFDLKYSQYFEVGELPLALENNIKKTYGGKYVTKEKCPDGYTETLPLELLDEIIYSIPISIPTLLKSMDMPQKINNERKIMNSHNEIESQMAAYVAESAKFEAGNSAAGTRARKALGELAKAIKARRGEITDTKNARAEAKKAG